MRDHLCFPNADGSLISNDPRLLSINMVPLFFMSMNNSALEIVAHTKQPLSRLRRTSKALAATFNTIRLVKFCFLCTTLFAACCTGVIVERGELAALDSEDPRVSKGVSSFFFCCVMTFISSCKSATTVCKCNKVCLLTLTFVAASLTLISWSTSLYLAEVAGTPVYVNRMNCSSSCNVIPSSIHFWSGMSGQILSSTPSLLTWAETPRSYFRWAKITETTLDLMTRMSFTESSLCLL